MGYNTGTIRGNYEVMGDSSDEENEMARRKQSPGPGAYQTMTSDFNVKPPRSSSIQVFGSTVSRFNEKPIGTNLGPGQYKAKQVGKGHNSALAVAGSAPFKA